MQIFYFVTSYFFEKYFTLKKYFVVNVLGLRSCWAKYSNTSRWQITVPLRQVKIQPTLTSRMISSPFENTGILVSLLITFCQDIWVAAYHLYLNCSHSQLLETFSLSSILLYRPVPLASVCLVLQDVFLLHVAHPCLTNTLSNSYCFGWTTINCKAPELQ